MFRLTKRLNDISPENSEKIYSIISEIDAVKRSWNIVNSLVPQTIERLTQSVVVTSSGSSNRIEGNRLSDDEVREIYRNINVKKFKTRDEQEIAGYVETLLLIFENYRDIPITESNILWLHGAMLKRCEKDEGHRGIYKIGSNRVEARDAFGALVGVIFDPTPPHLVKKEISELIDWHNETLKLKSKHPLIAIANFIFEYLAIHPFQDGNGRTSRLLSNLTLLRNGYEFAKIASHEKIIESNKAEYYRVLNYTQKAWKTDREDVSQWLIFFLEIVKTQALEGLRLLQEDDFESLLSEKQALVWTYILSLNGAEFSRKSIREAIDLPARTAESIVKKFLDMNKITKLGQGRAARYRKA
jgi:Fic family protein